MSSWIKAVERFIDLFEGEDNCWWYNERATLSTLAGAAWSLPDWIALEEFNTGKRKKKIEGMVESGELRNGRCDLFISNQFESYALEAKQAWQSFGARSDGFMFASRGMQDAWDDSGALHKNEAGRRFAATFIVPYIRLSEIKSPHGPGICQRLLKTKLQSWFEIHGDFLSRNGKPISSAYIFPETKNNFSNESYHFPGVVLVLEERFRAAQ